MLVMQSMVRTIRINLLNPLPRGFSAHRKLNLLSAHFADNTSNYQSARIDIDNKLLSI